MKKITLLISLLGVLLLAGCQQKNQIIAGPKNVYYDNDTFILSWDSVEGAIEYELVINDEKHRLTTTSFDLKDYDHGVYRIKVKAFLTNKESIYTSTQSFFVNKVTHVYMYTDKNKIYWNAIENATYVLSYQEMFSQVVTNLQPKTNEFKIPDELKDKNTLITLKTYYDKQLLVTSTLELNFNMVLGFYESDYEIEVSNPKEIYINGVLVEEGFSLTPNKVILSKELIAAYRGETQVSVTGDSNISHNIYFTNEILVLLTDKTQTYQGEDIVYEFKLNGFDFVSEAVFDGMFTFEDGTLTIFKEYFETIKEFNPNKTFIGVNVVFKKGEEHTILVYLEILL